MRAFDSWWVRATALLITLTALVLWACEVASDEPTDTDPPPTDTPRPDTTPSDTNPPDTPDMGPPGPGVAGSDPAGDQSCGPFPKLDILGAQCGLQPDGSYFFVILMADPETPTLGLYYSWFLRLTAFDATGAEVGAATVQEHDGVPDQLFEGALSPSNTTFTTGDDIIITFGAGIVSEGYTISVETGVLETASDTICTELAPDTGTWAVCNDPSTP